MTPPFRLLARKRRGEELAPAAIGEIVRGAVDGSWSEAQLAGFLTSAAIHGLSDGETDALTREMLFSGERWELARDLPGLADKHSTGGVGDKVSLLLSPLLAACGVPVAMLTGRGLGHTGGTADKLEAIPGLDLELDRRRTLEVTERAGFAIGVATADVAPADRTLYRLRDETATIESIPLITASILSKKLATGAAGIVFDVKTGPGAFIPEPERARELARRLVHTSRALGTAASAWITDMSQPLGRWVGHAAEVDETLDALAGEGPEDLVRVTFALCREAASLVGASVDDERLGRAIASGRARELFEAWAVEQGAETSWRRDPRLPLAPVEAVLEAERAGRLARVDTRRLGLLLVEAGGGRARAGDAIDHGIALRVAVRLGDEVAAGDELARVYLRRPDEGLVRRLRECFEVGEEGEAPVLLRERVAPDSP